MRKIMLVAALVLPVAAFANDDCRDASEFLHAAAYARDQGVPEKVSLDVMHQTIGKADHALYGKLNHLAYTAKRGTPDQLREDFRVACERSARP